MPTRDEIIAKLDKERAKLIERFRDLSAEDLVCACTQSEAEDGAPWTAKDHLAHLAMIERAFQGMIRRGIAGSDRPINFTGTTREEVMAGVHRGNQENVDAHRDDDLDTLLADLDTARAETKALLDTLTDEQLATPLKGAPWADGTIGGVLITNAFHEIQHWTWVQEGLEKAATS